MNETETSNQKPAGVLAPVRLVNSREIRDRVQANGTQWSVPLLEVLATMSRVRLYRNGNRIFVTEPDADKLIAVYYERSQIRRRPKHKPPAKKRGPRGPYRKRQTAEGPGEAS